MIKFNDFFNANTLNIFADASVSTINNKTTSCPGCCTTLYYPDMNKVGLINENYMAIRNSTNNDGEINAILLAVLDAIKFRSLVSTINIISDSMICIEGLREWIYNWINNSYNGQLYTSEGKLVKNQQVFIRIINMIIQNNIYINFYHCKGHVSNSQASLDYAKKNFLSSNRIKDDIDMSIIKEISNWNNYIDKSSRDKLIFLQKGENSNYYTFTPKYGGLSNLTTKRTELIKIDNNLSKLVQPVLAGIDINKYTKLTKNK